MEERIINCNHRQLLKRLLLLLAFFFFIGCNDKGKEPDGFIYKPSPVKTNPEVHQKTDVIEKISDFHGKVTGIKDGDTFEVLYYGSPEIIRLAEIDCPEKSQPFGKAAKKFASDLCFGKTVRVVSKGKRDRYGRIVATVFIDDINVNKALVQSGFAWHYKDYSEDESYSVLEKQAKLLKYGLWADKKPVPPWEWRSKKRKAGKKEL